MLRPRPLLALAASLLAVAPASAEPLPDGFVDLAEAAPSVVVELRYATAANFVGGVVDGYAGGRALLTREAAQALVEVQAELLRSGYGIKLFDAYRPQRAVNHFVRWARDLTDTTTQADYYPRVPKSELFVRGYIALNSGHSRGSTVDVTLLRRTVDQTWEEVDMGTPFDFFDEASSSVSNAVTPVQKAHRMKLQAIMVKHGWEPYAQEWWHFTLRDEPFPDTYFDAPLN